MNEQDSRRKVEIDAWLSTILNEEDISYEVDRDTLELLESLMDQCKASEAVARLRIEDVKQKTAEYASEAVRIRNILSELGLGVDSLSQSGRASLKVIAETALELETADSDQRILCCAMVDRSKETLENQHKLMKLRSSNCKLSKDIDLVRSKKEAQVNELELLNKDENTDNTIESKQKKAKFLEKKSKEYMKKIQQYELNLAKSGIEKELHHSELMNKADELQILTKSLQPLQAKLDAYRDLPPNILMAKVKLEELKRELAELDKRVTENMDHVHL